MITARLIDNLGCPIAVFEESTSHSHWLEGKMYTPYCWSISGEVYDKKFFADLIIKWDGCSHFSFEGQDSPYYKDVYYHICGLNSYFTFIRTMLFAYEVMVWKMKKNNVGIGEGKEFEEYKKLGLLNGYIIDIIDN